MAVNLSSVNNIRSEFSKTQKDINLKQQNISSDIQQQHYYDLAPQAANQAIVIESILTQYDSLIQNYDIQKGKLFAQEASIRELQEKCQEAKKLAVNMMNWSNFPDVHIQSTITAKNILLDISNELNRQIFDMNTWNGSFINDQATTDIVNGSINNNYYLGDDIKLQVMIEGKPYIWGNGADMDAIYNLITGVQMLRDLVNLDQLDTDKLVIASDFIDKAKDGLSGLLQKVGEAQKVVINAKENLINEKVILSEMYDEVNGKSEYQRAMEVIDLQAQQRKLEYFMSSAMKSLQDMSVLQYLN